MLSDWDPIGDTLTSRDLRSHEKARNRHRKQFQKYYGYRGVKPSWIGQQYYTFVLIPTTGVTQATTPTHAGREDVELRSRSHNQSVSSLSKHQQPQDTISSSLPQLRDTYADNWWLSIYHDNYISICASEARANKSLLCAPESLALVNRELSFLAPISSQPALRTSSSSIPCPSPFTPSSTAILTLRTWTKDDNFTNKSIGIWPLDRRHHRGKRYREKRSRKESAKQLRHGRHWTPQQPEDEHSSDLDWVIRQRGDWGDPLCCLQCRISIELDNHLDGAFQDFEELWAAERALRKELTSLRLAEGDPCWTMLFGADYDYEDMEAVSWEEKDAVVDEEEKGSTDCKAVVVSDGEAEVHVILREDDDNSDDAWSEISSCSSMMRSVSMSVGSDYDYDVVSSEEDFKSADEAEWEMLSTVVSR